MKLVVGGAGNGKLQYVLDRTGLSAEDVAGSFEEARELPVFYGLQNAVKEALSQGEEPAELMKAVLARNPEVIIICDEVGSGVVPMEREARRYRETVGRLCCVLAKDADRVERIICGLPTVLKGGEAWR